MWLYVEGSKGRPDAGRLRMSVCTCVHLSNDTYPARPACTGTQRHGSGLFSSYLSLPGRDDLVKTSTISKKIPKTWQPLQRPLLLHCRSQGLCVGQTNVWALSLSPKMLSGRISTALSTTRNFSIWLCLQQRFSGGKPAPRPHLSLSSGLRTI